MRPCFDVMPFCSVWGLLLAVSWRILFLFRPLLGHVRVIKRTEFPKMGRYLQKGDSNVGRYREYREKKLPVGIESFEKIRREGFYYVDKTAMIRDLLRQWGKVNLFTRPRRFGKSLNMSMLKAFLELDCDRSLFEGLEISKETALCEKYMGQFPVISISLKGTGASDFETARALMCSVIGNEALRFLFLLDSDRLSEQEKEMYRKLVNVAPDSPDNFEMSDDVLMRSLRTLSELLQRHFEKKTIILIDEYDVPLAKANEEGYYERMTMLIRNLFEQALKTNDSLYFAVLTGCLHVVKESIFTGLNNPKILSITTVRFDEYFGFTDTEVREMLKYYDLDDRYDTVKEWYDGYRFGNGLTKSEIEMLVAGETVTKEIHEELTYNRLYDSIDNIWSVLFMTGYLTQRGKPDGNRIQLTIPNREIRKIFTGQIMAMFKEQTEKDGETLNSFCNALKSGDADEAERLFGSYLERTVSIRDTFVRKPTKENFYQGILLGILGFKEGCQIIYSYGIACWRKKCRIMVEVTDLA